MKKIDLGMSYDSPSPQEVKVAEKHYPSFHYEGSEHLDIPKDGVMTVRYHKSGSEESEREGKMTYRCTIEVLSIEKVKGSDEDDVKPPASSGNDAERALDMLMKEKRMSKGY